MYKDEALRMAIICLEQHSKSLYNPDINKEFIDSLKEALEQPAQSITEGATMFKQVGNSPRPPAPPAPIHTCTYSRTMNQEYPRKCIHCGKVEALEQPAQEPVGYTTKFDLETALEGNTLLWFVNKNGKYNIPLYTHPAPSWQGLSDDEIGKIMQETHEEFSYENDSWRFARAIEQSLKEKNNVNS